MNKILSLICLLVMLGCASREYTKVNTPGVPPVTHRDPENPYDKKLTDWKAYSASDEKTSQLYQQYCQHFSQSSGAYCKKRLVVGSLEESLKPLEEKLKLALYCSGSFVIMDRDAEQIQPALIGISQKKESELRQLVEILYAQYLLVLTGCEKDTKLFFYHLSEGKLIKEDTVREIDVLKIASDIVQRVSPSQWRGVAAPGSSEGQIVVNAGAIDGIKAGDTFKLNAQEDEQDLDNLLVVESVEEKYAIARIRGDKKVTQTISIVRP